MFPLSLDLCWNLVVARCLLNTGVGYFWYYWCCANAYLLVLQRIRAHVLVMLPDVFRLVLARRIRPSCAVLGPLITVVVLLECVIQKYVT
jgi:hypothetical protein